MNKLTMAGKAVAEFLKRRTGKEYDSFIKKVEKNNQTLDAIVIMEKSESIGINLYPDVEMLESDFNEAVKRLCVAALDAVENNFASAAKNVAQNFKSGDLEKYPITLRFYQKETNAFVKNQYLCNEVSNLYLVPALVLEDEPFSKGFINITPSIFTALHLSEEEIFRRGISYLEENANILDAAAFAYGKVKDYLHEEVCEKPFLVSVGNNPLINGNGAPTILCSKVQKRLKEIFPEGYYIIPSSVHEMLCISKTDTNPDVVREIVSEINNTQVAPEDLLTTAVYEIVDGLLKQIA